MASHVTFAFASTLAHLNLMISFPPRVKLILRIKRHAGTGLELRKILTDISLMATGAIFPQQCVPFPNNRLTP